MLQEWVVHASVVLIVGVIVGEVEGWKLSR